MILKIKYENGYYVSRNFLDFWADAASGEVTVFSPPSEAPTKHVVKNWREIYIVNTGTGETVDRTIR